MTEQEARQAAREAFGRYGEVDHKRDGSEFAVGLYNGQTVTHLGRGASYEEAFRNADAAARSGQESEPGWDAYESYQEMLRDMRARACRNFRQAQADWEALDKFSKSILASASREDYPNRVFDVAHDGEEMARLFQSVSAMIEKGVRPWQK